MYRSTVPLHTHVDCITGKWQAMMQDILNRTSERARRVQNSESNVAAPGQEPADGATVALNPAADFARPPAQSAPGRTSGSSANDEAQSRGLESWSSRQGRGSRLGLIDFIELLRNNGIDEDNAPDEDVELVFSKHASMGTGGKLNFLAVQSAVREVLENAGAPSMDHTEARSRQSSESVRDSSASLGGRGPGPVARYQADSDPASDAPSPPAQESAPLSLSPSPSRSGGSNGELFFSSSSPSTQDPTGTAGTSGSSLRLTPALERYREAQATLEGAPTRPVEGLQSMRFISRPVSLESEAASASAAVAVAATEAVWLTHTQVRGGLLG